MDNSVYKQCSECGQTKHISEFSKSYTNRCKACVAEHTRMVRERAKQEQNCTGNTDNRIETMKARIKVTGEVVDVKPSGTMKISCGAYLTEDGRMMPGTALEFEKAIDWEQRRYELAKAAMQGFCSNPHQQIMDADSNMVAEWSIGFADSLINKLKGN